MTCKDVDLEDSMRAKPSVVCVCVCVCVLGNFVSQELYVFLHGFAEVLRRTAEICGDCHFPPVK